MNARRRGQRESARKPNSTSSRMVDQHSWGVEQPMVSRRPVSEHGFNVNIIRKLSNRLHINRRRLMKLTNQLCVVFSRRKGSRTVQARVLCLCCLNGNGHRMFCRWCLSKLLVLRNCSVCTLRAIHFRKRLSLNSNREHQVESASDGAWEEQDMYSIEDGLAFTRPQHCKTCL